MKKLLSTSVAAAVLATGFAAPAQAEGELSANVGLVSDYYFRGVNLGDAGTYAGLDYGIAGFYVGTWIIDDGAGGNDGLETDFYLGYGMEHGDFSWNIGYNQYEYTYTSDYESEFVVTLAAFGFALDVAIGEDVDDEDDNGFTSGDAEIGYQVIQLSYGYDIYGVTLGKFTADGGDIYDFDIDEGTIAPGAKKYDDPEYHWFEVSAGGEVASLDMGLTIGTTFESSGTDGEDDSDGDGYIILDISKSFTF